MKMKKIIITLIMITVIGMPSIGLAQESKSYPLKDKMALKNVDIVNETEGEITVQAGETAVIQPRAEWDFPIFISSPGVHQGDVRKYDGNKIAFDISATYTDGSTDYSISHRLEFCRLSGGLLFVEGVPYGFFANGNRQYLEYGKPIYNNGNYAFVYTNNSNKDMYISLHAKSFY